VTALRQPVDGIVFGTREGTNIMNTGTAVINTDTAVRPFYVEIADEAIADLRRRIAAWRPPEREPVDDQSQGVQLATVQDLARYWATEYDWRRCEAKLNALPQFTSEIDGLDIHFIHVRSAQQNALPLIVSHGWPGSVIEQLKIIEPLTNPAQYGGNASDAFDVVIPSLPGYGFSAKPAATGWGPERIGRAWAVLMQRLGYTRYVAQGGDWGTAVSAAMARQAPEGLAGIHVNFAQMVPPGILGHIRNGDPAPTGLSEAEKRAYEQVAFATYHRGYGVIQGTRPQTIGYSLADTPVGLAAWLLDHDMTTYKHLVQLFAGHPYGAISRDDWLDNTSLYWLTNTATSAARLYWQQAVTGTNFYADADVSLPAAVTVFPQEYVQPPRTWTEQAYHDLIYFHEAERGGHFAAWEQPQLFSEELRAAFRPLR
jgi:pimeloyl-ACP methyl ester carboxylesterase